MTTSLAKQSKISTPPTLLSPTKQRIIERLKTILDPEIDVDIVSLGLIYDAMVTTDKKVFVRMTLTSPGCPLAGSIESLIRISMNDLVADTDGDVILEITFDPPWTPDMMSEEVRLEYGIPLVN